MEHPGQNERKLTAIRFFAVVLGWGLTGAWGAMAFDFTLRGAFNYLRFRSGRWMAIKV